MIFWRFEDVPINTGFIDHIILVWSSHKYKVGHIDLIFIKHNISQIHLKFLNFDMCHTVKCVFLYDIYGIVKVVYYSYNKGECFISISHIIFLQ